jgi:DNA gyrase subunit A
MGRPAGGVHAIKLDFDDAVAGMDVVDENHTHMLVVTKNGFGKRTELSEYRQQGRYGQGVRTLARNEKTGPIVAFRCINENDDIMLITMYGVVLRTRLNQIRETGRSTQGVTVMDLYDGDEVVGVAIMSAEAVDETPDEQEGAVNGTEVSSNGTGE